MPSEIRTTNEPSTERGEVTWHGFDEDGGPDVGLSMGLGLGRLLWVGELPERDGWWLSVYDHDGREDFARFDGADLARRFFDELEALIKDARQEGVKTGDQNGSE